MALTRIIKKEAFDKLTPALQGEYKAGTGDAADTYTLDLTDYEDPAALKRAKDHERDQAKEARRLLKEAQDQLLTLTEERDGMLRGSIPKADAEKLENSWKEKLTKREKELNDKINAANGTLQTLLVDNVAQTLAAEISTAPAIVLPHIKARLKAEQDSEGKFVTKVLDKDGKPSALSVAELKEEFVVNPDFKSVITASKASGGGAGGGGGGGGAHGGGNVDWKGGTKAIAAGLKSKLRTPGQA